MFKYLAWSENIKKRVCRYLLQRYLGQFLQEKLTLDQLSVDLYNGTGNIYDVSLDCEALDELGESQGWPFEFVDGYIRQISVVIPWSTLLRDESCVEVHGLCVTIQPKVRFETATSMLESMWSSMSSSMQMAAECLQQEPGVANAKPVEGIEHFAATIDSILSRVKIRFINTKIRMEHMPKDSSSGVALEVHVKNIEYCDEAGTEPTDLIENEKNKTFVVTTFSNKRISFEGISLHTDEFPSTARTMAKSLIDDGTAVQSKIKDDKCDETENENKMSSSSSSSSPKESTPEEDNYMSATDSINLNDEQQPFPKVSSLQESLPNTRPILFAKITGKSELYIKLKQSEDATGPKVELQLMLGSLITFLSPRQLHTIIELCDGLASPHLEDTSNVPVKNSSMPCKPMKATDFERVEAQLLGGLVGGSMPSLLAKHGWSGADHMDDSEMESECFLPLTSPHSQPAMSDSCASSVSSLSTSTSTSYSSKHRVKRNKKIPQIDGDPTAEVSHINIRVASFACILLHNDILFPMLMGDECLTVSSVKQMQETAESFFEKLGAFAISGYGNKDFEYAEQVFEKALTLSHLRLITASVTVEGNEKTTSQGCLVSAHLTVARAQLQESLYTNTNTRPTVDTFTLLHFQREEKDNEYENNPLDALPDIKIHFTQTQKAMRIAGEKRLVYPTADFHVNLQPCTVDLDITLLDRIWAVLHPLPLCQPRAGGMAGHTGQLLDHTLATAAQFETHTSFKVTCSKLLLKLRFPVIDLRPQHDMCRTPWWQRNVRPDHLQATLQQLTVSDSPRARHGEPIKIQAHQIDLHYFENETCSGFHLGRAHTDTLVDTSNIMFGIEAKYPTINLTFLGSKFGSGALDHSSDEEPGGVGGLGASMAHSAFFMDGLGAENAKPSPFSHKKTMHQSDTPHEKDTRDNVEELIVPGSPEEMSEFEQHSINRAAIQIECQVPVLSVQLDSKHLYEVIYNRINSDLLLWEPTQQNPYSGSQAYPMQPIDPNIYPVFSMCKNGLNYDSDTASSSSDESNVYYSTYEQKCRDYSKAKSVTATGSESGDRRHNLCLSLKVGKGLLTMYTLVRDTQKNVVSGQLGEAVLNVSGLSLCHVSGVRSNSRTALLALYAQTAKLYHAGLIPAMSTRAPLRLYGCGLPSHLIDTIYPSGKGVRHDATGVKEMLTIALSVQPNLDLPNYKNIKVSVGIRGATLRHRTEMAGRSWLMQLMDQLDVLDYPVPGYRPSTVLTQLHVHLWDCAIDYRPLNLPLRAIVTMGSFSISSNVIAEAHTSNLRFIAEECGLFLADMTTKEKATQAQNTKTVVNLQKDYVCVVDLGLFELSLRLTEKSASVLSPRVDLRASNDAVHVRTCADSARALCRLLAYVVADGDATDVTAPPQREHTPTPAHNLLGDGVEDKVTEEIRDLSPSEVQQVNDLMAEAMKESPNSSFLDSDPNNPGANPGVEVFFFPDEPHPKSSVVSQEDKNSSVCVTSGPAENQHLPTDEELQQESVGEVKSVETETVQLLPAIIHVERDLGNVHADIVDRKNYKHIEKNEDTLSDGEAANTDDEFCMLGDEMTARTKAKVNEYAEPVVRWLTSEPMTVLDNHFALPQGKGDVLKAPKNFPVPVTRYTLCEMTLVWHMYGGNDFNTNTDTQAKKSVTINDRAVHSPTLTRRSSESDPYNVIPRSPNYRYSAQSYLAGGVSYKKGHEGVRLGETQARGSSRTPSAPWKHRGGAGRLQTILVEIELNKMKFRHESYPGGGRYASRQTLAVGAMQVRDRHNDSHFNMFLNLYTPDDKPRARNTNMVCIKAVHLRPDPRLPAQECCLKVSLQPLRFIIDQDTLLFLSDFFSKLGEDSSTSERTMSTCSENSQSSGSGGSVSSASRHSTPTHQLPVMSVGAALKDEERRKRQVSISSESSAMINSDTYSEDMASLNGGGSSNYDPLLEQYEAEQMLSDNLIQLEEGCRRAASVDADSIQDDITETSSVAESDVADDAPIYFRRVIFSPEVPIRLDYYGKRVNLSQGSLAGIVVGLVLGLGQLNCSELRLKRLSHRHGLLGFNRLLHWLLQEWLHDIKRNQLAGILGGVGPMRSLLQLFQGVYDLFRLPWEQWRRDGRVVRGLRRGAASFSARTAIAALDITTRLVHLIQATAETAFDMLTPSPSLGLPGSYPRHRRARRRNRDSARPPQDIREGVANAYQLVKEGFSDTAATMVCVAAAERDARGYSGAVGGVLRQLPGAAVAPVALAAAAAADILGGVRAQLVPGALDHARDKWRRQPCERDARVDLDSDVEEAEE